MRVSHETIYKCLFVQARRVLKEGLIFTVARPTIDAQRQKSRHPWAGAGPNH